MKFPKLFRKKYLGTSASVSSQVILFTMHEKDTANEEQELESSQIYMMESFWRKQLTASSL